MPLVATDVDPIVIGVRNRKKEGVHCESVQETGGIFWHNLKADKPLTVQPSLQCFVILMQTKKRMSHH